jgi:hypothetical protein
MLRRIAWHLKRIGDKADKRFFYRCWWDGAFLGLASVLVWLVETDRSRSGPLDGRLRCRPRPRNLYQTSYIVDGLGAGAIVATITGALGPIISH